MVKRYVITGASGFLGQSLKRLLVSAENEVIDATRARSMDEHRNLWIEYDLKDSSTIANIIEAKPHGIFHLAWSSSPGSAEHDPAGDVTTNLAGTCELFRQLTKLKGVRVVFASSGGTVYGDAGSAPISEKTGINPKSVYGITKAAAERYGVNFRYQHGLDLCIARIANPFGAEQSSAKMQGAAPIFARSILAGDPITIWGDGQTVRDYIAVDDVASALIAIMTSALEGDDEPIFNVGSGEGVTLNGLIEIIGKLLGIDYRIDYMPGRSFDVPYNVLDIKKITAETGWVPKYQLDQAVGRMVAALKSR